MLVKKLYRYCFFIFYRWGQNSHEKDYPHIYAAFILALPPGFILCILFELAVKYDIVSISENVISQLPIAMIGLGITATQFIFNVYYFGKNKRYLAVVEEFKKISESKRRLHTVIFCVVYAVLVYSMGFLPHKSP